MRDDNNGIVTNWIIDIAIAIIIILLTIGLLWSIT